MKTYLIFKVCAQDIRAYQKQDIDLRVCFHYLHNYAMRFIKFS